MLSDQSRSVITCNQAGRGPSASGHGGLFWGDRNLLHFECDGSYLGAYICQNSSNGTVNIATFYCMDITLSTAD